jgi:glycosyltransferase involved in cell wall biosynthesis
MPLNPLRQYRVAVVHYWFVNYRGGEQVVDAILKLLPQADVYTHLIDRQRFRAVADAHAVYESFIARVPGARKFYQKLLPLMPLALEQFDLRGYDLIISSESGPAKGVLVDPDTLHICYCHSPMRYLWDMYPEYRGSAGPVTRLLMPLLTHYLRLWDQHAAHRVDQFIANSRFIQRRIRKTYRRDSVVIHPPVSIDAFAYTENKAGYYLLLGQVTAYKRPDLGVRAFAEMPERELVVIGEGEMLPQLRRDASTNVTFLGHQPFAQVKAYLQNARALIFPGVEDFGIVPVEALACGTPVIAYGAGGVLESITDGITGIYFHEQNSQALAAAIQRFERWEPTLDRPGLREAAERFSEAVFQHKMQRLIRQLLGQELTPE